MADEIRKETGTARRSAKGSDQRKDAMYTLIDSTSSDDPVILSLIAQHLADFAADFPEERNEALNAAYDICEKEDVKARLEGYRLLTELARVDNGEIVGAISDTLLQMLRAVVSGEDAKTEISAIERSFRVIIPIHPAHALGLLTSHLDNTAGVNSPELVWNLLSGPVEAEVKKVIRGNEEKNIEAQKVVSQNLYQLLETGDADSRKKSIDLLLDFSTITGPSANKDSSTHLLSQIVYCALELPPTENEADLLILHTYLTQIDTLISLLPTSITLDTRWLLLLYYHFPDPVFDWAKKPVEKIKPGDGPSRLVDWLITAWGVWKREHMSGEAAADEKLVLTRLGPQVMEAAFKQAPTFVKGKIHLPNVMPVITDLEVCILLTYFTFLKFKGRNNDIFDEASKTRMAEIADVCEKGLASAVGASQLVRRKWENVQRMIQNLLSRKTDTVQPSWTLAAAPAPAPVIAPSPQPPSLTSFPVTAVTPAAPANPIAGSSATPDAPARAIPTGPARMQIAGRAGNGKAGRRGSYNEQRRGSGPQSQAPAMAAGSSGAGRATGLTIRRAISPPNAAGPSSGSPSVPFSISIKSSAATATPPTSANAPSTTTTLQRSDERATPTGPSSSGARPITLSIRNTAGGMSIRNTSPAAPQPAQSLQSARVATPPQPFGIAAGKRKRDDTETAEQASAAGSFPGTPSSRGPSLLSRLGMGGDVGGSTARGQTPPSRADSTPVSVVTQQAPTPPAAKRRKSGGNPPQIPPGQPSLLDRMQGVTATGSGQNRAIPSLLARMQPAAAANGNGAPSMSPPGQRTGGPGQLRNFPAAQQPSFPQPRTPQNPPPTGPAVQADGIVRRGRGFANAGIALPPQNQGLAVKGRTNR